MKLSKDDPRLTAYALGEIENEQERAAIEAAVRQSKELQQAVAGIRGFADQITASLAEEPAPELSEFEKAKMGEPAEEKPIARKRGIGRILTWPVLSAATAAAAVALIVFVLVPPYGSVFTTHELANGHIVEVEMSAPALAEPAPPPAQDADREGRTRTQIDVAQQAKAPAGKAMRQEEVFELSAFSVQRADDSLSIAPTPRPAIGSTVALLPPETNWNTESYDTIEETGFRSPLVAPLSTFSIDVDTASYANVRRFLNQGQLPPADAVRIEELINYFPYSDTPPAKPLDEGGDPFAVYMDQTVAPWAENHRLLRIALKGYVMPWEERPASNLVFLLDVSGSMNQPNKLPLLKQTMDLLVQRLDGRDRVAVVVYAGASGLVLPSTTASNRETIAHALSQLAAGGSTNAGAGIQLAYKVARDHFIHDGNNRVILCTDGDFNVGVTNRGELAEIAEKQAEDGISLTILGFGMGNYKDDMLEELSNKGKGSYAYVDSEAEARKVFLEDLTSNLFKIAKDVKIQVEFNPAQVKAYRLIGYENRRLKAEDFNDDTKKAGDIGPGHSVVALYQIIPAGEAAELPTVDPLKYQEKPVAESGSDELATVKLRYKQPDGDTSKLITRAVNADEFVLFASASTDVRFAAAVAAFGMRLSESEFIADYSYDAIGQVAAGALGTDPGGHRSEFVGLVRKAGSLSNSRE